MKRRSVIGSAGKRSEPGPEQPRVEGEPGCLSHRCFARLLVASPWTETWRRCPLLVTPRGAQAVAPS